MIDGIPNRPKPIFTKRTLLKSFAGDASLQVALRQFGAGFEGTELLRVCSFLPGS